ncbi:hypothetical protein JZ751_029866, partial [Albula glossodonta]
MKRKASDKSAHVVAWINKAEWDQILEYLYSKDCALQKFALHRISAWKGRFGSSTPVAVESTADLVRCQVLDSSGHLESDDLVLLYGTALVRFVNLITERKQRKVATPLRRLANKLNIPEWIVNLRHDITHRRLPTLKWCRKGCQFVLEWLQQEYWSRQLGSRLAEQWDSQSESEEEQEEEEVGQEDEFTVRQRKRETHKKARELLISYEKEQFQQSLPNQFSPPRLAHGRCHRVIGHTVIPPGPLVRHGFDGPFRAFDGLHKENRGNRSWASPSSGLGAILVQVKHFAVDSRTGRKTAMEQELYLLMLTVAVGGEMNLDFFKAGNTAVILSAMLGAIV